MVTLHQEIYHVVGGGRQLRRDQVQGVGDQLVEPLPAHLHRHAAATTAAAEPGRAPDRPAGAAGASATVAVACPTEEDLRGPARQPAEARHRAPPAAVR